jgi:hypothetical protein
MRHSHIMSLIRDLQWLWIHVFGSFRKRPLLEEIMQSDIRSIHHLLEIKLVKHNLDKNEEIWHGHENYSTAKAVDEFM